MADTGLPWELPYPLPTDLVRDGADAIKDLAEATAAGLTAAGNAGIGSNVVQTVKTDTFTEALGAGDLGSDITGLTATITPSSATSLILVMYTVNITNDQGIARAAGTILRRDGSDIAVGAGAGSRRQVTSAQVGPIGFGQGNQSATILDNPETTSPVTYSIRTHNGTAVSATVYVNRVPADDDNVAVSRQVSSITAIEVAA